MANNDLTFNQISTVLTDIVQQATGQTVIAPVDAKEFVTVGQLALKAGYDPLLQAISQVLSRTIFSVRPYSRKFKGLEVSNQRFGNWTRKLNISDASWVDTPRFELVDGQSIDQYTVHKPNILQTNFYGSNVFDLEPITIFKDQLDCAFESADEFARFISMIMSNASDRIEQAHENIARATIGNLIGAKVQYDSDNVIHLLTEYNTLTGLSLTAKTVYQPDNFVGFMQWVWSRLENISDMMTERSLKFHINVTGKEIMRHTPKERQRVYMYAPARHQITSRVLADTYHDNLMRFAYTETVNFWQNIDSPTDVKVKPVYLKNDGTIIEGEAETVNNVFAVITDAETMGYTVVNQWSATSPFNAAGGYTNYFWHFTDRYLTDFTENAVVLVLD